MAASEVSCIFPKDARLTQRAEFDYVFAAPEQRSSDRYFTVLGRFRNCAQTRARLGLVIAKKRLVHAHERNRIKRLVRESFRQYRFPVRAPDLIVLAKSSVREADNAVLFRSLERHWQKTTS